MPKTTVYWRYVKRDKGNEKMCEFYSEHVSKPIVMPAGSGERFRTLLRQNGNEVVRGNTVIPSNRG